MLRLRLKELLDKRGITPYRLAKDADLSISLVYRLVERGDDPGENERVGCTLHTLEAICRALNAGPEELLEFRPPLHARRR